MPTVQYVRQPTRLQVIRQYAGDRGGVTNESQTLYLWVDHLTIEVKTVVRKIKYTAHVLIEKAVVRLPASRQDDDIYLAVASILQYDTTGGEFSDFGH